jgi:hypothetical protein
MKNTAIILTLLGALLLPLSGCLKMMGKTAYPTFDQVHTGVSDDMLEVPRGGVFIDVFKGIRKPIVELDDTVVAEWGGADMVYPPAAYGACDNCLEETDEYYFFYYPENNSVLTPDMFLATPLRAGLRVEKDDFTKILPFAYSDFGDGIWTPKTAVNARVVHWIDFEKEYHYKTVTFASFEDDILTLVYKEEQGPTKGVGTEEEQLTLQFDLLESKTIRVKEAEMEVVEAAPDKLVVKIIKSLTL